MLALFRMNKFLLIFKRISRFLALPLLSGILVGTSYIPFGWALFFCYVPLWLQIRRLLNENGKLSHVFWSAWVTQFILTLIGFNWIYYVTVEFGHLHWTIAVGTLLLFSAFMHLYIPLSLLIAAFLIRKFKINTDLSLFLVLALMMSLIERIWPSIFEWNLAYTLLWLKIPLFQWADTVGFWGLSTWIFIIQSFIALAVIRFKSQRTFALKTLGLTASVVAALTGIGALKKGNWSKTEKSVRIGVVQGNIGNAEKLQSEKKSEFHSFIRSTYTNLTEQLLRSTPTDLVIWPETAMPFIFKSSYHNRREQQALLKSVNSWGVPVVTGAYDITEDQKDQSGDPIFQNAVFFVSPNYNFLAEPYYKTNLLAFGEYMPFGQYIPILYKLLPFVGNYADGSGPVVAPLELKNQRLVLGPQICYDSLAPDFSRDLSRNGAQVIFNVTNDSWFGWWAEPFQHQYMTLARAIEVRRPLVRSTNTGVSSAILADGTVLEESPIDKPWVYTYEIPYREKAPLTLYVKFGHYDWIIWLLALFALLAMGQNKETTDVRS
jgi:apolipoprotein N-acyltransferase